MFPKLTYAAVLMAAIAIGAPSLPARDVLAADMAKDVTWSYNKYPNSECGKPPFGTFVGQMAYAEGGKCTSLAKYPDTCSLQIFPPPHGRTHAAFSQHCKVTFFHNSDCQQDATTHTLELGPRFRTHMNGEKLDSKLHGFCTDMRNPTMPNVGCAQSFIADCTMDPWDESIASAYNHLKTSMTNMYNEYRVQKDNFAKKLDYDSTHAPGGTDSKEAKEDLSNLRMVGTALQGMDEVMQAIDESDPLVAEYKLHKKPKKVVEKREQPDEEDEMAWSHIPVPPFRDPRPVHDDERGEPDHKLIEVVPITEAEAEEMDEDVERHDLENFLWVLPLSENEELEDDEESEKPQKLIEVVPVADVEQMD